MHWFWRAIISGVIVAVPAYCVHGAAVLLIKWPADIELVDAIAGLPLLFAFLLVYRHLPLLLPVASAADLHPVRQSPYGWCKWVLLGLSSLCAFLAQVANATSAWHFRNWAGPATEGGFPSTMTPHVREIWMSLGWLRGPPGALNLLLLYLFWRDWRQPKKRPGFCDNCNYNLTGNTSGVCPECGETIPRQASLNGGVEPGKADDRPQLARFFTSGWSALLAWLFISLGAGFISERERGRAHENEFILAIFFVAALFLCVAHVVSGLTFGFSPRAYCRTCGYSLIGNTSGLCPECGAAAAKEAHPPA